MKNVNELSGKTEKNIPELNINDVVLITFKGKEYFMTITGIQSFRNSEE